MNTVITSPVRRRTAEPGWAPLAVLLSGTFLVVLDFFIVNVALPSVQHDLHTGGSGLQWVVAAYGLSTGGLLLAAGRLGDRWGRRRMFRSGLVLFVLASAACGLATNAATLVAARVVQGVAAAMLIPMVLALIGEVYEGPRRLRALGAYTTVMGFAAASGQLIGGLLIQADIAGSGWRAIFMVNVPIGVVAAALTPRLLPESVVAYARVDVVELLLSVGMLTAAILPLLEGQRLHWPPWTWAVLAGAALLATGLAVRSRTVRRRGGQSLLDPVPFGARAIRVAMVGQGLMFIGMASYFLFLAIYLQQGRHLSPLGSGLVFSMLAVAYLVGTRRAPSLLARIGRLTVVGGASAFAVGHLLLLAAVHEIGVGGGVLWLAPGLVVSGLGMGVCLSALVGTVMATVEPRHAATVSGALSTVQQLGNAFGVAVLGMVFFGRIDDGIAAAFEATLACLAVVTAALALLGAALPRR